jgi:hypothetical protein
VQEIIAEVRATARAPRAQVFERILAADTRRLFTGYGPVAAVTSLDDQSGPWDTAGRTRRVTMSDGSAHVEELLYVDPPRAFGFELREAGGPLGWLTHGAHGHWRFDEAGPESTKVHWRYVFRARQSVPYPVGWVLLRVLWASYMRAALRRALALASAPT